jgi:hypothetical protein
MFAVLWKFRQDDIQLQQTTNLAWKFQLLQMAMENFWDGMSDP